MRTLSIRLAAFAGAAALAACAQIYSFPPQVKYSEIEPPGRAAKPPDCDMPVLRSEPLRDFRKVAIIEGTGNVFAGEKDVLPAVKRRACESGADAIVILASKSQTTEGMVGYYIDSVAIVYGSNQTPNASENAPALH
jgi:hypothetical protein